MRSGRCPITGLEIILRKYRREIRTQRGCGKSEVISLRRIRHSRGDDCGNGGGRLATNPAVKQTEVPPSIRQMRVRTPQRTTAILLAGLFRYVTERTRRRIIFRRNVALRGAARRFLSSIARECIRRVSSSLTLPISPKTRTGIWYCKTFRAASCTRNVGALPPIPDARDASICQLRHNTGRHPRFHTLFNAGTTWYRFRTSSIVAAEPRASKWLCFCSRDRQKAIDNRAKFLHHG